MNGSCAGINGSVVSDVLLPSHPNVEGVSYTHQRLTSSVCTLVEISITQGRSDGTMNGSEEW